MKARISSPRHLTGRLYWLAKMVLQRLWLVSALGVTTLRAAERLGEQLQNVLGGRSYINFHAARFPGGETRGAVVLNVPDDSSALDLDGIDDCVQAEVNAFSNVVNSFTIEFLADPTGFRPSTAKVNAGISILNQRLAVFPDQTVPGMPRTINNSQQL